jgi:hypothetical protein
MYKLPFSPKNEIRARNATAQRTAGIVAGTDDNDRVMEFAIPGLMDPATVTINLEHVNGELITVIRGEVINQETASKHADAGIWRIEKTNMKTFEEHVEIPPGAVTPAPKATLTVAKDNCGNIDSGVLRLSWATVTTQVPIEIKDCSASD